MVTLFYNPEESLSILSSDPGGKQTSQDKVGISPQVLIHRMGQRGGHLCSQNAKWLEKWEHIPSLKKKKKRKTFAMTGQLGPLASVHGKIMEQDPPGNHAKPREKQGDDWWQVTWLH